MSLSSKASFHHNMLPHHKEMLVDTLLTQLPICQPLLPLEYPQAPLWPVPSGLLHGPLQWALRWVPLSLRDPQHD